MLYVDTSFWDNQKSIEFASHAIHAFQPMESVNTQLNHSIIRYHYTSASAMMAILNTNAKGDGTVRFTDSRYMNDRSELLYFIKRLLEFLNNDEDAFPFCHKVVDELLLKKHSAEEYISLRVPELEEIELDPFVYAKSRHFLFCLSKDGDSLHMWNYYIHNGNYQGYNIGINVYDFLKHFDDRGKLPDKKNPIKFYFGDVLYSPKKQEIEIEGICKSIEEFGTNSESNSLSLQLGMARLWEYIECYGLFFKDNSFSDEKEYRIVIQVDEVLAGTSISSYFKHNTEMNVEFTFFERNGVLVPCLMVPLVKKSVKRITMAPILENKIASYSLNEYLVNNEYEDIEIKQSDTPIRY